MRRQFAFMYSQYPRTLSRMADELWLLWVVPAMLVSGWQVLRARNEASPAIWLFLSAFFVIPIVVITWLQNPLQNAQWQMVMTPFWIPAALYLGVFAAIACANPDPLQRKAARAATCILLVLVYLGDPVDTSKRHYHWVDDYARALLQQLPQGAILFTDADHAAFPILYLQEVEGIRKDVTLGNLYGYVDIDLIPEAPTDLLNTLGCAPRRGLEPDYFQYLLASSARPVYFSRRPKFAGTPPVTFRQEGLLYRAVPLSTDTAPVDVWSNYPWYEPEILQRYPALEDYTAQAIIGEFCLKRAEDYFARGQREHTPVLIKKAVEAMGTDAPFLNNLATMLARNGEYAEAIDCLYKALLVEPWNPTLQSNLEKICAKKASDTAPPR